MNNPNVHFSLLFIEMIINQQCTLRVAYHSLLEAPLALEALGLGLDSLLVNTALRSMLPNLSLVTEFLGNVFTNFICEKLLSHEALVTGSVAATSSNQTQLCNWP